MERVTEPLTQQTELLNDHPDYIGVTFGMKGYFAVYMKWCDDHGGFYEPWNSGDGYKTRKDAEAYAKEWALADGVPYKG